MSRPIDEYATMHRPGMVSGCLLVYVVGWWLTCAFVTGMALASYG